MPDPVADRIRNVRRGIRAARYHAVRAMGGRDSDRVGLLVNLGQDRHVLTRGYVVRQACAEKLDVRKLAEDEPLQLKTAPGVPAPPPMPMRPAPGETDDGRADTWVLLSSGHARRVFAPPQGQPTPTASAEPATPSAPEGEVPGGASFEVLVGEEHVAKPFAGQRIVGDAPTARSPTDVALSVYSELGEQVRTLIDVRFKLLALVPSVSAVAILALLAPEGPLGGLPRWLAFLAAVGGFIVTGAVRVYDVRNSQLHDDLISRGRSLEHELGVRYGVYMQRRSSVAPVEHDAALRWLYGTVLAAWAVAAVVAAAGVAG